MTGFRVPPPTEEEACLLYGRLLDDDPLVPTDIALGYLDHLTAWLADNNPKVDEHLCSTAAEEAILALIKNPHTYQPGRQTMSIYLRLSAKGDLKNLLRTERKYKAYHVRPEAAEVVSLSARTLYQQPSNIADSLEQQDDQVSTFTLLSFPDSVYDGLSQAELEVLRLMQMQERRTHVYGTVLGITDLPFKQQRQQVKLIKDRLQKRIARAGGKK